VPDSCLVAALLALGEPLRPGDTDHKARKWPYSVPLLLSIPDVAYSPRGRRSVASGADPIE
jgi:hypothetical protein